MKKARLRRSERRGLSLFARSSLLLFLVLLVCGVGVGIVMVDLTRNHMDEIEQKLNRDLGVHLLAEEPILTADGVDRDALHRVLHTLMVVNPRIELYVLAASGDILAFEAPPEKVLLDRVDLGPVRAFLGGAELPLYGDDPKNPERRATFSAAPVNAAGGAAPEGYLYVVLQGAKYRDAAGSLWSSAAVRMAASGLAVAMLVALLLGLLLLRRVTRRVERLERTSRCFLEGGFEELPRSWEHSEIADRPDELDRLEHALSTMAQAVVRQMDELEQLDLHRRELVANVSHDLRTPLAILQGYLETLDLKTETLPEEERARLLGLALAQAERLGRLVADLFDLAKLDAGLVTCVFEEASIAELVQDIVQKFELRADERDVDLRSSLDQRVPPTRFDVRLMERVIENLVDNALRHTPAGGSVDVVVRRSSRGVQVRVADTGVGIETTDLPHVFEASFRGSRSRSEGGTHAGLGLAIVRRVLELHGSTVRVHSPAGGDRDALQVATPLGQTSNPGTSFSFDLATAI